MVTGTRLGPYEILSKIGEGGMGAVYKARDTRLDRFVAIKQSTAEAFTERFEREARAIAALNHPNISHLYDVGPNYLVIEFVEGATLQAPMPVRDALRCADQILDALHAAHSAGIVHRDLKPGNILLTKNGRVKVLDFGLARFSGQPEPANGDITRTAPLTGPNAVMGTPHYMSPEQIRAQDIDARSDIFSFGLILHELLSGKRAYDGASAVDVMSAVLKEPLPELPQEIPASVRQIVADCAAKDRDDRFASANDVRLALRAAALPLSSSSFPPVEGPPAKRAAKSRLTPILAASCVALLALAGWLYTRRPGPPAHPKFTPIAADRAIQHYGAWSPDGASIAYISAVGSSSQLMVRRLNSPTAVKVADVEGLPRPFLSWFPAGDRILYVADAHVYAARIAGGEPELLYPDEVVTGALSPDGKTLAVWKVVRQDGSQTSSLWYASPLGSPLRPYPNAPVQSVVLNNTFLRFSPDGHKLGVNLPLGGGTLAALHIFPFPPSDRSPIRHLTNGVFGYPGQIDWFSDSRHVLLSSRAAKELIWADTESDWQHPFTTTLMGQIEEAGVSPDGKRILFTSRLVDFNITELPLDGSMPRPLRATARNEYSVSASATGQTAAFLTDHSGSEEVWVRDLAADFDRRIAGADSFPPGKDRQSFAAISPDGSKIAYLRLMEEPGRDREFYMLSTSGGVPVKLNYGLVAGLFSWSPDSRRLALPRVEQGMIRLAIADPGSGAEPALLPTACRTAPVWSPDGTWIACGSSDTMSILLISPDGKTAKSIGDFPEASPRMFAVGWTKDSRQVLVASSVSATSRLSSVDVATGAQRLIADYGNPFIFNGPSTYSLMLATIRSGKSVAVTTSNVRSEIVMAEDFADPRMLH